MPPKWVKVCEKYPKNYKSNIVLNPSPTLQQKNDTDLNAQVSTVPTPDVAVKTVLAPEVALTSTPDVAVETVVVPEGWTFESVYTGDWV